jgi:hypothetical protein
MNAVSDRGTDDVPVLTERPDRLARWAGIFYSLVIIAPISMLVRAGIMSSDAATTAHNLLGQADHWRLSVLIDFAGIICYIVVTALLYRLFRACGRSLSVAAAFLSLAGCIVSIVGLLTLWAPLVLLEGGQLAAFPISQMQALAVSPLALRNFFFVAAMSLFGLYCICIGSLIVRATFIPKVIGPLMMLSGACYLVYCLLAFLAPAVAQLLFPTILLPGIIGEGALTVWLLAKGVDATRWHAQERADLHPPQAASVR